jgi:3-mercaptopyruvate sulfurtransferase SseA
MSTAVITNRISKLTIYCVLLAIAGVLFAQPLLASDAPKGNLVDVAWLERNLKNPNLVLLDVSSPPVYAAKHIPGAVSVNLYSFVLQDLSGSDMEKIYQSWGISPGKKIVLYDQGADFLATRVFFSLYHDGFPAENLFVLDGGLSKWQEKGFAVTDDATPAPIAGTYKVTRRNEGVRSKLPEVLTASGDPANSVLVEALGPDWHFGEVQAFNRAGHIPNAILLPSSDFFNPDKTFKSPDELRKMMAYYGIRPDQQIYSYCGGGVSASAPFFAIKFILNYPKVKLFKESELGWLQDERELPYWTYDLPSLMRQAAWLQGWSNQRIRMYAGTRISIIDVRSAEAFNQGHMPFALNIPSDSFRNNIANPDKLAKLLGPAGVNVIDEAVVVSGAGLTKDSALAFLMLEKLGQKKVSVFMDSMDQWTKLGFPAPKDATVVGPKKTPFDPSIPPTMYPENFRKDVIIADSNSTVGVYPKIFIASGKDVPAKSQVGKVVHVPYTDLLNADGTPKAAKDIWKTLVKAGVPRYAEIICFSDDPGEAAANYYILKLMGFPDVKVLVS